LVLLLSVTTARVAVADFFSPLSPLLAPVMGKASSRTSLNFFSPTSLRSRLLREQVRYARRWLAGRGTAR
jgi:hypothetical protein